ncbi:amidohydrolase family protein [Microbacterium sp. HJ5]
MRQITLAPELTGALAAVHRFADSGIAVALGHTSADDVVASAAFVAGASMLTHAFNGMRGIHHRAPGPVLAAVRSAGVTLEVINDGVHVHPDIVRLAFDLAPERVALVTDAMAAAGGADGTYVLGSVDVVVSDGVARLADGSSIAGSTLTQDLALRRAVMDCGIAIESAVTAVTSTPARAIGRAGDLGRFEVGFAADAVLLTDDLIVTGVWSMGSRIV